MRRHGENSVYFGTESKLLRALTRVLKRNNSISIKTREVSREAKIANSSFYLHYHSLPELIDKNEEKILKDLNREVRKIMKNKNRTLKSSYRNILLFLYKYREFLSVCIESDNIKTLKQVAKYLKPLATENWSSYGKKVDDLIFSQFSANLIAEFIFWKSERFLVDEIPKHAENLAALTTRAPKVFSAIYYK